MTETRAATVDKLCEILSLDKSVKENTASIIDTIADSLHVTYPDVNKEIDESKHKLNMEDEIITSHRDGLLKSNFTDEELESIYNFQFSDLGKRWHEFKVAQCKKEGELRGTFADVTGMFFMTQVCTRVANMLFDAITGLMPEVKSDRAQNIVVAVMEARPLLGSKLSNDEFKVIMEYVNGKTKERPWCPNTTEKGQTNEKEGSANASDGTSTNENTVGTEGGKSKENQSSHTTSRD